MNVFSSPHIVYHCTYWKRKYTDWYGIKRSLRAFEYSSPKPFDVVCEELKKEYPPDVYRVNIKDSNWKKIGGW